MKVTKKMVAQLVAKRERDAFERWQDEYKGRSTQPGLNVKVRRAIAGIKSALTTVRRSA